MRHRCGCVHRSTAAAYWKSRALAAEGRARAADASDGEAVFLSELTAPLIREVMASVRTVDVEQWVHTPRAVHACTPSALPETRHDNRMQVSRLSAANLNSLVIGCPPQYSNANGVIAVAAAMLTKSVAVGTMLALIMSVATLSLPEMLILRKVIRWQALAIFAAVLAVAFSLVSWGFHSIA